MDSSGNMSDNVSRPRRKLKRHGTRLSALFLCGPKNGNGRIKNLSNAGLFMRTEARLPLPGAPIQVLIRRPNGEKLEVVGVVRWTTEQIPADRAAIPGFGMMIDPVTDQYRQFYEDILLN